jgi:membrane protease YdiL (CAAX protease family)
LYIADVYHDELANLHTYPGFVYMVKNYRKISSPWTQLGLFMLLLGAAVILTGVLAAIILSSKGMDISHVNLDFNDPGLKGVLKLLQGLNTVIVFALPALLYARLTFRQHPGYYLGLRPVGKNIFYGLAVALLLFSFPLEGWLGELNKLIHLPPSAVKMEEEADKQINAFLRVDSPKDIFINVFLIALLPAVCEELCFRGALQRILIQIFKSPWLGILVTGMFFSAFHMQFQGFLPRMFLGMLLGAIYWYSGSLWTSILAHFFYNGIQVLAVSFYPKMIHEDPTVPVYAALISLVIVVGLLTVLRRKSEMTYARVYEPPPDPNI